MSFNYARANLTASRLIAGFGQAATLRKTGTPTGPAYDPTPGAATFHPVTVVDLDQRVRDRSGTLTGETMRTLYISAENVSPDKGDRIMLGSVSTDAAFDGSEIMEIRTLAPAGVAVMYEADMAR